MRGWGVESVLEVQNGSVDLLALIQDFSPVVYNCDQLSYTAMPFFRNACCLSDKSLCSSECAIIFEQTSNFHAIQVRETG